MGETWNVRRAEFEMSHRKHFNFKCSSSAAQTLIGKPFKYVGSRDGSENGDNRAQLTISIAHDHRPDADCLQEPSKGLIVLELNPGKSL